MKSTRSLTLIAALWLCVLTPVIAAEKYLAAGHPDSLALLAPPPVPGSAEYAADLASARSVCKGRTAEQEAHAMKSANLTVFNFAPIIGAFFETNKVPKTDAFFSNLKQEIREAINIPKDHWQRKRPYQVDNELSVGKPEKSFSYPSGHSTQGMVQALVLAELFPDKRDALLEAGRNIGWDRVVIGKHFPTDVQAGRVVAQAIFRELMASPAFRKDLAEVKAELESARGLARN